MKTIIKVIENDYLDMNIIGVILNVGVEIDEMKIYFFLYKNTLKKYYIFEKITDIMKFGITNEGANNVFMADKNQLDFLKTKPFTGWLTQVLKRV